MSSGAAGAELAPGPAAPAGRPASVVADAPSARALLAYALLAAPLAFAALPLYVYLPDFYARQYGVSLAALGSLLFVARLVDALADPWIGTLVDRWLARGGAPLAWRVACGGAALLVLGFAGLWWAPRLDGAALLGWLALALACSYLGYSLLTVLHQSWGTLLVRGGPAQARVAAFREGLALAGVVAASAFVSLAGERALPLAAALLLLAALLGLARGPRPQAPPPQQRAAAGLRAALGAAWGNAGFRRLCAVFVASGIAAAVPATLIIFFVNDRLGIADAGPFLLLYFAAAALSLPAWVRLVRAIGLERSWLTGMLLAIATFASAGSLGAGDGWAYAAVCIASGLASGADLALPSALVARAIEAGGHRGQREGAYFGIWNFLAKLNLALAAGLALPLLQWLGYQPGARDPAALDALAIGYCWLPCGLKALAALLLWALLLRAPSARSESRSEARTEPPTDSPREPLP
jgi:Na+/melibiose symporter-like transporter